MTKISSTFLPLTYEHFRCVFENDRSIFHILYGGYSVVKWIATGLMRLSYILKLPELY